LQRRPLRLATAPQRHRRLSRRDLERRRGAAGDQLCGAATNIYLTDLLGCQATHATLARVTSGKVTVRDFARRKNIRLRKGQSYVAKKRRKRRRG
jgi:hypothetical protein